MNEIGEKLKETRESMGITIEEATQDLKVTESQIENIESGNREAFKDIFYLKEFIKSYSKYLGLDYDEMVEEFNEYLFDFTSKISIDDIKKAEKEQAKKDKKIKEVKISSPYTVEKKDHNNLMKILIISGSIILIGVIICIVILLVNKDNEVTNTISMKGVEINELT